MDPLGLSVTANPGSSDPLGSGPERVIVRCESWWSGDQRLCVARLLWRVRSFILFLWPIIAKRVAIYLCVWPLVAEVGR